MPQDEGLQGAKGTWLRTGFRPAAAVLAALAVVGAMVSGADLLPRPGDAGRVSGLTEEAAPAEDRNPGPTPVLAASTVVSLTFDVGFAGQHEAARQLAELGLHGTFFVTSGFIGEPGYLTRDELAEMEAAGHEIGGHTKTLADLPSLLPDEAARQVCNGRSELIGWGHDVRNFSYPFGSVDAPSEKIVLDCGYNTARTVSGQAPSAAAAAMPPTDWLRTPAVPVTSAWTLEKLQAAVAAAEKADGGTWLQLVFHEVGEGPEAVSPDLLRAFAEWLAARTSSGQTVVRPVRDVSNGPLLPAVAGPQAAPPPPGQNAVRNPGLETEGRFGLPECWRVEGWGTHTTRYSRTGQARSGQTAEQITVTDYVDGDAKLMPVMDFGGCSPAVVPGAAYDLRAWYIATGPTQFAVYYRTAGGAWLYWTSSPYFPPSEEYVEAAWTTPPVPAEATGISFGLNIFGEGQLITDDYGLYGAGSGP